MSLSHPGIECVCEACEREREESLTPKRLKQIREYAAERAAQGAYGVVPIHLSWVNRLLDAADERDRLAAENSILQEQLACAADLTNSWCRESSVPETGDPYRNLNLRTAIDGLWSRLSGAAFELNRRLDAKEAENAELKRRLAELTEDDGR